MDQNGGNTTNYHKGQVMNKYNVGSELWCMIDNRPRMVTVLRVKIEIAHFGTTIVYVIDKGDGAVDISQCNLFNSKQKLLDSL